MLDFLKKYVREAGRMCIDAQESITAEDFIFKADKDLVTAVDREVEEYLVELIRARFPEHGIIREEGENVISDSPYCWVIDPIDGTTSFAHGQPYYSISVALMLDGKPEIGVIYGPALGQLFYAERGRGAFLNGDPLRVSNTDKLIDCVLATGFACLRSGLEPNNLASFTWLVPRIRDIRRCGSAALDLAYVAAGKYDGFWEMNLNLFDIAAGALLVEEAGGIVSDFDGGNEYPGGGIVAANARISELLRAELR